MTFSPGFCFMCMEENPLYLFGLCDGSMLSLSSEFSYFDSEETCYFSEIQCPTLLHFSLLHW